MKKARVSMRFLIFVSNLPNPSGSALVVGLTQPVTEMLRENVPGEQRAANT
jgi:hypothetical protein